MIGEKILILGGTGLLGKAIMESCPKGIKLFTTHLRDLPTGLQCNGLRQLDVSNREETQKLLQEIQPYAVVHMAGLGSVDFAEKNQHEAWVINVQGTQNVIDACRSLSTKLIYISSNAVFDGNHPPYHENSVRQPVNYYGQLKVESEDKVQSSGLEHAIVRPILMYGWHYLHARENPVTMWLRLLGEGKPLKVVNDRYWQPLYVEDCADLIWTILEKGKTGLFNISGPDRISLYEFALKASKAFGLDSTLIEPVSSSFFPTIAPRPFDTSFILDKIQTELGMKPVSVDVGLKRMKLARTWKGVVSDEAH